MIFFARVVEDVFPINKFKRLLSRLPRVVFVERILDDQRRPGVFRDGGEAGLDNRAHVVGEEGFAVHGGYYLRAVNSVAVGTDLRKSLHDLIGIPRHVESQKSSERSAALIGISVGKPSRQIPARGIFGIPRIRGRIAALHHVVVGAYPILEITVIHIDSEFLARRIQSQLIESFDCRNRQIEVVLIITFYLRLCRPFGQAGFVYPHL